MKPNILLLVFADQTVWIWNKTVYKLENWLINIYF